MTPRQGVKIVALLNLCDTAIKRRGAHARVPVTIPGTASNGGKRRLSRKGPRGLVIAHTHNGKKTIAEFSAAELKTSLEEIFYGTTTGRNRN